VRIAFFINDLSGGGAEKALTLLSGYLAANGVEVLVITMESDNDGYSLAPNVERVVLRGGRGHRGVGKILSLPLQAFELSRVLRRSNPDACVSFLPRSNVAHVMTRWFGNRRPILLTEQISSRDNYPSKGIADRVMRALIAGFYPRANAVLPSSEGVKDGLISFGVDADRMHVVYNAVALAEIRAAARESISAMGLETRPTIITIGRHAEQKDHETLLRAFAVLRERCDARLVMLGQGPLRDRLVALATELGIASSVIFAGWQTNPFAWLARADLFVLSSRYEGFGNVLVEAMACGLPVISTDCPSGPSEILRGGEFGMLVPVGDVPALASAMESMLNEDTVRERFRRKSEARAPEFDISIIGPAYATLLRAFTGNGTDGRG
jgi:GalNAc-alpha-(1->4)-GalNAc-alpha-(1->3)-diNAcBac-PP-undecaprenol alpha-1,4-N-acetyl-D-galactosaminyltransferase